jgi:hypothetical protein
MSSLEQAVPKLWLFDEQKMNPPFSMLDIYIPRQLNAGSSRARRKFIFLLFHFPATKLV